MKPILDIIIPTFNNPRQLISCINSIKLSCHLLDPQVRILVVNNGNPGIKNYFPNNAENHNIFILEPGENLRWEGGLKYGLARSSSPFVLFANDDIRFVPGDKQWLWKMLSMFNDPAVGAVGPSSNFVMGPQQIFSDIQETILESSYLIGFCMMVRREALEKADGIDDSCPGGDDIDLSIRLHDAGYKLIIRRDIFVFHHGEGTGKRVLGDYWNSPKMQEATNLWLIKKHGMKKFYQAMVIGHFNAVPYYIKYADEDVEGNICRKFVEGDNVLELGCGGRKTVERAKGVDLYRPGQSVPRVTIGEDTCRADLVGDVSTSLPVQKGSQDTIIARHILEHIQDPLTTLSLWNQSLRMGGRLIIAVPHNGIGNTILMNPEHINSFTPSSLRSVARVCGFKVVSENVDVNGISFVSIYEKIKDAVLQDDPVATVSPLAARISREEEVVA